MPDIELRITRRGNKSALWIGGKCVWDLPDEQVTDAVLKAIRRAYAMGYEKATSELRRHAYDMRPWMPEGWTDERPEIDEEAE